METGLFPLSKRKDKPLPLDLELPCSESRAQNHSPWPHFLLLLSYWDAHLQSPALLTLGGPSELLLRAVNSFQSEKESEMSSFSNYLVTKSVPQCWVKDIRRSGLNSFFCVTSGETQPFCTLTAPTETFPTETHSVKEKSHLLPTAPGVGTQPCESS